MRRPDDRAKPLPRSLYAATARPAVAAPPLDRDADVANAVIGMGFTGLSAALHLAEDGAAVIAIDANEPGWGASGRNGGQVNPGLKLDPAALLRRFGPRAGHRLLDFGGAAPNLVFELIGRHGIACDAVRGGTIRAAITPKAVADVRTVAKDWAALGAPAEFLDRQALARATGTRRYAGAYFDRRGGHLNPLSYARGLAEAAQKRGARLCGGTPALRLRRQGAAWQITTPSATIRAERVILATNGYTGGLWPSLAETVVPVWSAIAATEPLPPALQASILPELAVVYEQAHSYAYYRMDAMGRFLLGGRSHQRDTSEPRDYAGLTGYAVRLFPALKAARWTHVWNGRIAITQDRLPHLHEPAPGLHIGLGYNGRGVALATAVGRELALRALGAPADSLALPLTPIRPMPLHSFWPLGVWCERMKNGVVGWLTEG